MGCYATVADYLDRYPEVLTLFGVEDSSTIEPILDRSISEAEAEIELHLTGNYDLDLMRSHPPALLKKWTLDIARWHIDKSNRPREFVYEDYATIKMGLRRISDGKDELQIEIPPPPDGEEPVEVEVPETILFSPGTQSFRGTAFYRGW